MSGLKGGFSYCDMMLTHLLFQQHHFFNSHDQHTCSRKPDPLHFFFINKDFEENILMYVCFIDWSTLHQVIGVYHQRCTHTPPSGLVQIHSWHNTNNNPESGSIIISTPHHTPPTGQDSPVPCRHIRYSNKASPPGQNRGCLHPVTGSQVREYSPISTRRSFYESIMNAISSVNCPIDRNRPGSFSALRTGMTVPIFHRPTATSGYLSMLPEPIGRWYRHSLFLLFSFISRVVLST